MSPFYCVRVIDGLHTPGVTTDGIDFTPIPKAATASPRKAVDYCLMRQADVTPLRAALDDLAGKSRGGEDPSSRDGSSAARSDARSEPGLAGAPFDKEPGYPVRAGLVGES